VTERFEALYQGKDGVPGLYTRETLLAERPALERLSSKLKLGVVTGRPRRDALTFLEDKGIGDLFSVVTTMEDGPPKPDPAPVRAAIERLGVERAWMLGDTPDDVVAARAARVLPIGVVPPGGDPDLATESLTRAGAARVLLSSPQIEEVLP
jgi:HAD superfamily hydrolase (TIGR01548 family)